VDKNQNQGREQMSDIQSNLNKRYYELGVEAGVGFATERITKLLDTMGFTELVFKWWNEVAKDNLHEGHLWEGEVDELSDRLIALIKGEQPVRNTDKLGENK
jgi:hypothetical protein